MARMYVWHKVSNFKNWKKVYDEMHDLRKQFGCTGENVFHHDKNANELLVITSWGSKEEAMKYGKSPELKKGMEKAGVVTVPDISFSD